jgi:hypothetical protein
MKNREKENGESTLAVDLIINGQQSGLRNQITIINLLKVYYNKSRKLLVSIGVALALLIFCIGGMGFGALHYWVGIPLPTWVGAGSSKSWKELIELHTSDVAIHNNDVATHKEGVAIHIKDVATHREDVRLHKEKLRRISFLEKEVAELRSEKKRMTDTHVRLDQELKRKTRKLSHQQETAHLAFGFLLNDPNSLKQGISSNPYRPNGFPVTEWHPVLAEALVKASVASEGTKALQWLTAQEGWCSILSEQTVLDVSNCVSSEPRVESDMSGATALHSVTTTKLAKLLIAEGANVNATTRIGRTPLHNADTLGIAELLIAKGAEVNAVITGGRFIGSTPLDTSDNADIAELLRKHGGKTGDELKTSLLLPSVDRR